jgi:hypothetical protein
VLDFFIAGLLFCALSTSNIGSVSHPAETGLLIPSGKRAHRTHYLLSAVLVRARHFPYSN